MVTPQNKPNTTFTALVLYNIMKSARQLHFFNYGEINSQKSRSAVNSIHNCVTLGVL